jgi:hypothetical protein
MKVVIVKHKNGFYTINKNGKTVKNRNGGTATFAAEQGAKEYAQVPSSTISCSVCFPVEIK